ncbi:MAG TPA: hypothetical protein VFR34_11265 [Paracoccaceae bacterium]|nr:hypothetical protein [Paracoccaceae bacterium]
MTTIYLFLVTCAFTHGEPVCELHRYDTAYPTEIACMTQAAGEAHRLTVPGRRVQAVFCKTTRPDVAETPAAPEPRVVRAP